MDFTIFQTITICITLFVCLLLVRKYKNVVSLSLIVLLFLIFQFVISNWFDFIFLVGVSFILLGINMEYMKLYNRLKELEKKKMIA